MLRRGVRSSLACAFFLLLPGCITRTLWGEDDTPPPVATTITPCLVHELTAGASRDARIEVRFSVDLRTPVPAHLRRYTPTAPGLLSLSPPAGDGDWRDLPGAGILQPDSFELRVTRASYFTQPTAAARLRFHGTLPRARIAHRCEASELPQDVWARDPLTADIAQYWPRRALEGFAAQPWGELLAEQSNGPRYHAVPIAWVDPQGRIADAPPSTPFGTAEEVAAALASFADGSLLVRLDGEYGQLEWAMIPNALLLQGKDLQLRRDGDTIRWTRTQIWRGRIADAPPRIAAETYAVPLASTEFPYRWMREVDESTFALNALRVLATPVTAVLDFAIMTNPYLANALRETTAEEQPDRTGQQQ